MRSEVRALWLGALFAQVALLAALTVLTGTSWPGWLSGLGWSIAMTAMLVRWLRGAGDSRLQPADRITLTRGTLVGGVAALVCDDLVDGSSLPALVSAASVALALDALDGYVARRSRSTEIGARFDMEVDAFLILVLSCAVASRFGIWVLVIGLARYGLGAAEWLFPWLRRPVPPRFWRKVVAAVQGIVLTCAVSGLLPRTLMVVALLAALALLAESFGRDVWWLSRRRREPSRPPEPVTSVAHG